MCYQCTLEMHVDTILPKCSPQWVMCYNICAGVTIFYQRAEQEVVRLAEISCSSGLTPTPDTITNTLANLEQK